MRRGDLSRLRSSIALFLALCALGGLIVAATVRLAAEKADARRAALSERDDMASRLARAEREAAELARRIELYSDLSARVDVGKEYRSVWLRRLNEATRKRRIAAMRYELAPRQPLARAAAPAGKIDGYEFTRSAMKVRLSPPHEEDLLAFISDLAHDVHAILHVRGCDVVRGEAGLDAECDFDWITLRQRP